MSRQPYNDSGNRNDRNLDNGQNPIRGIKGTTTIHTCPHCGCENTHHAKVDVYARMAEDSEQGVHAAVDRCDVKVDFDIGGNPSIRRDGIRISMWCECCDFIHDLEITQHKGQTIISTENIRPDSKITGPEACRECFYLEVDRWAGDLCRHENAPKQCRVNRVDAPPGWCPIKRRG